MVNITKEGQEINKIKAPIMAGKRHRGKCESALHSQNKLSKDHAKGVIIIFIMTGITDCTINPEISAVTPNSFMV
jgi:hypothetical protein